MWKMAKRFIIIFILLCTALIDINLLIAKTDEEIKYQIRLEKRQEYCSNNHIVFFYSQDFIQPFEDIDPKNINSVSELYCMATFYENEGKLDEAMQNYLEILSLAPNFIDIIIKVGDFYKNYDYSDKDYNLAVLYYRNALKLIDNYLTYDITFLDPYIDVYNKIIYNYNEMCVPEVSVIIRLNLDDELTIGIYDLNKCRPDSFIAIYDEILDKLDIMLKNPDLSSAKDKILDYKIQFLLEKADKLNGNDKTNYAIQIYSDILNEIDPKNATAIKKLSEIYVDLGLLNEAKDLLEYAKKAIPDFEQDDLTLYRIYFNLGEKYYNDALVILNKAINNQRSDTFESKDLQGYIITAGDFDKFKDAALGKDTKYEEELDALKKSIDDKTPDAFDKFWEFISKLKDDDKIDDDMIELINEVFNIKITNYEAYMYFKNSIEYRTKNAAAYYYRGRIYYAQDSCNKAKQDFNKAKEIHTSREYYDWSNVECN
jgi:tetratricopeptide (TPR) repeat protein